MSKTKLKPCPFCGGEASLNHGITLDGLNGWVVECRNYECIAYSSGSIYYGQDAAMTRWNTRKPVDDVLDRLEEELRLSEEAKEYARSNSPLQFERSDSYSTAIDNAIGIVKEVMGYD